MPRKCRAKPKEDVVSSRALARYVFFGYLYIYIFIMIDHNSDARNDNCDPRLNCNSRSSKSHVLFLSLFSLTIINCRPYRSPLPPLPPQDHVTARNRGADIIGDMNGKQGTAQGKKMLVTGAWRARARDASRLGPRCVSFYFNIYHNIRKP